ncbi:MAG TPA: hypothetical protein VFR24_26100 [Candidatus Angelobacter sp.]|nr:hypothetical protein [Candidatus Angelobacter sp.]
MAKIVVPKPAKNSFNKDRPASDLLKAQVKHLHEMEKNLPHRLKTGRNVDEIKTEGEASAYIKAITNRLHPKDKIKVPRPAAGSFHKHRPLSDLLKRQVEHFREAERSLPPNEQTGMDINEIRLEHEAATYIGKVTAALHARGAAKETKSAEQASRLPKRTAKSKDRK